MSDFANLNTSVAWTNPPRSADKGRLPIHRSSIPPSTGPGDLPTSLLSVFAASLALLLMSAFSNQPAMHTPSSTQVLIVQAPTPVPNAVRAPQLSYVLHGVGPFRRTVATAVVTRLSPTRFSLSLQAEHLPSPELLHTRFPRHAYVAWLVDGMVMHGPMRMCPVGLVFDRQTGTYRAQGSVSIDSVTAVVVTAEPTAQAYMPILPLLTVLTSVGPNQMRVSRNASATGTPG